MNTTKSRLTEARTVATDLLQKIETSDLPIERHLLQAKRLARLLRDTDAQKWLDLEISGYQEGFDTRTLGDCFQYAKAAGRITKDSKYFLTSLPRLEAACAADRQRVENAGSKPNIGTAENFLVARATTQMLQDQISALGAVKESYLNNVALFSSLKAAIHSYVTDTLIAIEFGDVAESIFDKLRQDVDSFIRSHSPKAAEKLLTIAERMAEGNAEAHAEALTSCRRLLMTVADSVFPPSDKDWVDGSGKKRKVGVDNYKNRLVAFIESRLKSNSSRAILENELEHLCSRLDAVYEKACKGVHTDVSAEEARLAIIEGYIFIGEIARLQKLTDQ
ncbi:MAG: hypothetical protein V2B20_10740 [Pseudomonadota bacterium]